MIAEASWLVFYQEYHRMVIKTIWMDYQMNRKERKTDVDMS